MRNLIAFVYIVIVWLLLSLGQHFGQTVMQTDEYSDQSVSKDADRCAAVRVFFVDSMVKAKRAGGIALDNSSCSNAAGTPDQTAANLQLEDKLELLTNINPVFSWKDTDGVINLLPSKEMPDILTTKIGKMELEFDQNLDLVIDKLLQAPEITEQLKKLNLRQGVRSVGLRSPADHNHPLTRMTFKNKTLPQILNAIVKRHGRGVWLYSEAMFAEKKTFNLDFVVR